MGPAASGPDERRQYTGRSSRDAADGRAAATRPDRTVTAPAYPSPDLHRPVPGGHTRPDHRTKDTHLSRTYRDCNTGHPTGPAPERLDPCPSPSVPRPASVPPPIARAAPRRRAGSPSPSRPLFALTSIFAFASPSRTFGWDNSSFSSSSESQLVSLTNRARASAGLPSLKVDSTLTSVARWRSKDMITRDYFSHSIPGYGKVWDKLHAISYCYKVARREHRLEQLPRRHRDSRDPGHVHGLRRATAPTSWARAGITSASAPTRARTARRCGRCCSPTSAGPRHRSRPEADRGSRLPSRTGPGRRREPTARPTPKPTPRQRRARDDPEHRPRSRRRDAGPATRGHGPDRRRRSSPHRDPTRAVRRRLDRHHRHPQPGPGDDTAGDGTVGMRVVDDGGTDGLLQSIVGGVTGLFFGG